MEAAELRRRFLSHFEQRGHAIVPSASLIPHDPTLLFTIAGMVPFKPYFLGEETPPHTRVASIQKCFRVSDIEIIGTTTRHHTFFEMLGNFAFGDYFKAGAIEYAWSLVTEGFGLEPDRLWVTVHESDDEAAELWVDLAGLDPDRVQRLGDDNFWQMGETGPCGPSSEIFFDKGPGLGADGGPAFGGEERFVEIWNLVFMQNLRAADGTISELPKKNIDTGSGLERTLAVINGVDTVYALDLFAPLLEASERAVGRRLGDDDNVDVAIRRIADHGRAMTMLVADGVLPSNEGRGYVLRRIIRRAILAARRAGSERAMTADLVTATVEKMGDTYPNLVRDRELIEAVLDGEERGFSQTLRTGLVLLGEAVRELNAAGTNVLPGEVAFRLHDTHGFPIELTSEFVAEHGIDVDRAGFDREMSAQRERAQAASRQSRRADDAAYRSILDDAGATTFVGREIERYSIESTVVGVLSGGDGTSEVFLDVTPFYAEAGGQVGDTGAIVTESGRMEVDDTQLVAGGLIAHRGTISGQIVVGQGALATIDAERREAVRRHHTATHLLHAALRSVLGDHVRQQGSLVAPDRLRFDFSHGSGLAPEERGAITGMVNRDVVHNAPVETVNASRQEAEQMGAIAFFGDKYGDRVRVVRAGPHSLEFCGGTHVAHLGDIGQIQVISEGSIGSNTRRIEAVSGMSSLARSQQMEGSLQAVAGLLKSSLEDVVPSLERVLERQKALERTIGALRQGQLGHIAAELDAAAPGSNIVARVDGFAGDQLRQVAQDLQRRDRAAVVLAGADDGKVALVAATDGAIDAAALVNELARAVGGGGGGSSTLALAGGRDVTGIDRALEDARSRVG
jgi:alanyl-tRNA synthetase